MSYIVGTHRDQIQMLCMEVLVLRDSMARVIDMFVESVIRGAVSFTYSKTGKVGRPSFDPCDLIKLYMYGYYHGIKSSRKLERACYTSLEVMWLVKQVRPDFRTIADFRKNNVEAFEQCFTKFIDFCKTDLKESTKKDVFGGYKAIDGTKVRACQAKDGCYTAAKIGDRIDNDKTRVKEYEQYIEDLNKEDKAEDAEEKENKKIKLEEAEKALQKYKDRLEKHEKIQEEIAESNEQYSENDGDSRLMKNHYGGYNPSYNTQAVVDSESHMIESYDVTNKCTDHGLICSTVENIKEDGEIISTVADNGYDSKEDLGKCLENGIIPNVFLSKVTDENGVKVHKNECEITFEYEPNDISAEEKASTKNEDLSKCLHAGIIPDCYADQLSYTTDKDGNVRTEVEIKEVTKTVTTVVDPNNIDGMSDEERLALALKGYFVRDIKGNKVYCPAGQILYQKAVKANGAIRYCNKLACKNCPMKETCFTSSKTTKWKEVDFSQHARIKGDGEEAKKPVVVEKKKVKKKYVVFKLKMDREKLENRKCLSEHPFGTIKRYMNGDHFLLVGKRKVSAEMALTVLGYNFKRLISLFTYKQIYSALAKARV